MDILTRLIRLFTIEYQLGSGQKIYKITDLLIRNVLRIIG